MTSKSDMSHRKKMTSKNDMSHSENESCSIPLAKSISLNDNQENSNVIQWINSFEFARPKRNIARDFSDASKVYICYVLSMVNN